MPCATGTRSRISGTMPPMKTEVRKDVTLSGELKAVLVFQYLTSTVDTPHGVAVSIALPAEWRSGAGGPFLLLRDEYVHPNVLCGGSLLRPDWGSPSANGTTTERVLRVCEARCGSSVSLKKAFDAAEARASDELVDLSDALQEVAKDADKKAKDRTDSLKDGNPFGDT